MTSYVLITDEPERVRQLHGSPTDWSECRFRTAADALAWERERRGDGSVSLTSQGWQWGCAFTTDAAADAWVAARGLEIEYAGRPRLANP